MSAISSRTSKPRMSISGPSPEFTEAQLKSYLDQSHSAVCPRLQSMPNESELAALEMFGALPHSTLPVPTKTLVTHDTRVASPSSSPSIDDALPKKSTALWSIAVNEEPQAMETWNAKFEARSSRWQVRRRKASKVRFEAIPCPRVLEESSKSLALA